MIHQLLEDLIRIREREYRRYQHSNMIEYLYFASGIDKAIDMIQTAVEEEQKNCLPMDQIDKQ